MANKAHTATLNRICQRYGLTASEAGSPYDIETKELIIEVETSASLAEAVERLASLSLPRYIAITNREGLQLARQFVAETMIGLLDPQGEVIVASGEHTFSEGNS